ncbi:MAG: FHA domain-containing protein [Anaerolineales bacterium]|jgi:pSer/pThr/pTyr-binding forkhead associated (FHA) protein
MNPAILMLVVRVLLAMLLYAFLAAVLILLWRDIKTRRQAAEEPPAAFVRVADGPGLGKSFSLSGVNTLGRGIENDISLLEDTVSTRHARIAFREGKWWIEDLGSKNGTTLNRVPAEQPLALASGDEIGMGRVNLIFEFGVPEGD